MNKPRLTSFQSLFLLALVLLPDMPAVAALPPHVDGEVLVTFRSASSAATMAATQAGIATMKRVGGNVYDVRLQPDETVESMLTQLQNNPLVDRVQPNYIKRLQTSDPYYDQQWGLKNTVQLGVDIHAEEAWSVTRGDPRVVVAVIDTGIAGGESAPHPDLQHQLWQNPHEIPNDGLDNDGNGIVDDIIGADVSDVSNKKGNPLDLIDGHGTQVASIIGAEADNGIGITGVAPGVKLMIIKAFSGGVSSSASVIAAIDYAIQNGASIINASYGQIGSKDYGEINFDFAEYFAIQRAESAGILFVTAAGNGCINDPTSLNYDPHCPYSTITGYDNDHPPDPSLESFVPASYNLSNIIAVAATDRNDDLTFFSNYGATTVDLAAPGQSIVAAGLIDTKNPDSSYYSVSGTSVAVPFVSGTLALMYSAGDTSAYSLKNRLLASVDSITSLSGKVASGGRLNAAAALAAQPVTAPSGGGGGGGCLGPLSLLVLVAWRRHKG